MKIFATSDIHGNKALVQQILKIVRKENIDALIISGDSATRGFYQLYKHGKYVYQEDRGRNFIIN